MFAARNYKPSVPVGARSTHARIRRDPGRPRNFWDCSSIAAAHAEIDDLVHNRLDPQLSQADHADYWSLLFSLMISARDGVLDMGARGEGKDIRGLIVELRPRLESQRGTFGRSPRALRLYYAEPDSVPQMLLALALATKGPGRAGLDEQDETIEAALERVEEWCDTSPRSVLSNVGGEQS